MRSKTAFWRSLALSAVFTFNFILLLFGISTAYENIQAVFRGEEKSAVQIDENGIRMLDFYYTINIK